MQACLNNTRGICQRCGRRERFVLASAFNSDGSFRFLCAHCERMEWSRNNRVLFDGGAVRPVAVVEVAEVEPVCAVERAQLSLF
jgi:hypothetical protein